MALVSKVLSFSLF